MAELICWTDDPWVKTCQATLEAPDSVRARIDGAELYAFRRSFDDGETVALVGPNTRDPSLGGHMVVTVRFSLSEEDAAIWATEQLGPNRMIYERQPPLTPNHGKG